eukprot:Gregarina_sp_Pseudo_9__933@NODE_1599_length_1465_cov_8_917251_g1483_i0_p2_GENE_NODE_1599_length_1465_cov_8_917251_g1483_i0NODE_1599_length_1465_cov_8_917251_g1483_i0_p2_ORF_typecomplete_len142_score7_75_NODE_1599_length_1465_cov_8_917251_g1483_i09911416
MSFTPITLEAQLQQSLAAEALAETLKDMTANSFITKEVANILYGKGLEALQHVLQTTPYRHSMEGRGRLLAYRCHRNTWTLWASIPGGFRTCGAARKRNIDGTLSMTSGMLETRENIKITLIADSEQDIVGTASTNPIGAH